MSSSPSLLPDGRPDVAAVRRAVLGWARRHERPLPWKGERDPYRVLVGEVMLQQTQAPRVIAPYRSFLTQFPTVASLARAKSADVLRAWGNLGYNRRALHVHRAAGAVVERGCFPSTVCDLETLPGVGPYTVRAVASFAFGVDAGVVDTNVRRVLTRAFGTPSSELQPVADRLVPRGRSAEWNQALIDLGAEVCRARDPRCAQCPLNKRCRWRVDTRPRRPVPVETQPFASTNRYARGRVMQALRASRSPLTRTALLEATDLRRDRLDRAVRSLSSEMLVTCRRGVVSLGSTPAGRQSPSRRRRSSAARSTSTPR